MSDLPPILELQSFPLKEYRYAQSLQDSSAMERLAKTFINDIALNGFAGAGEAYGRDAFNETLVDPALLKLEEEWIEMLFSLPLDVISRYETPDAFYGHSAPGREAYRKKNPELLKQFWHFNYSRDDEAFFPYSDEELATLSPNDRNRFRTYMTRG